MTIALARRIPISMASTKKMLVLLLKIITSTPWRKSLPFSSDLLSQGLDNPASLKLVFSTVLSSLKRGRDDNPIQVNLYAMVDQPPGDRDKLCELSNLMPVIAEPNKAHPPCCNR